MRINTSRKSGAANLALTGLMGALVIVGTFISIPVSYTHLTLPTN